MELDRFLGISGLIALALTAIMMTLKLLVFTVLSWFFVILPIIIYFAILLVIIISIIWILIVLAPEIDN